MRNGTCEESPKERRRKRKNKTTMKKITESLMKMMTKKHTTTTTTTRTTGTWTNQQNPNKRLQLTDNAHPMRRRRRRNADMACDGWSQTGGELKRTICSEKHSGNVVAYYLI